MDDPKEFITVGFSTPVVGEAVWIYETFNPDAVNKVTISTKDGDKVIYQNTNTQTIGVCSYILAVPTKTCSPISAVRVDLASEKVAGYNEIDAIGILPPP